MFKTIPSLLNDLFKTFATTCNTNRLTIATNQGTAETLAGAGQTRTTAWNGVISHTVTITFATSNAARHFFNAGGEIRFAANIVNGTGGKTLAWVSGFAAMSMVKFSYSLQDPCYWFLQCLQRLFWCCNYRL